MARLKTIFICLLCIAVGIVIGGYLFSRSQPRSFLAINRCEDCMSRKDLAGLLASVAIQRMPGIIPSIAFETDKTIAIKLSSGKINFHYVIIPKKDIKNIGELSEEDSSYLTDAFLVARHIIEKEKLTRYRMFTNGPYYQDITYLHFHLVDDVSLKH